MKFCKLFPQLFVGLKSGLIDVEHQKRMRGAIWLFLWCIMRQTGEGKEGVCCRGCVVTYEQIAAETGYPRGNIRNWMRVLVRESYVRLEPQRYGFIIWIQKPRKFSVLKSRHPTLAEGVHNKSARMSLQGQSKPLHPIEKPATSELFLRNNLTKLPNNSNTDAAANTAAVSLSSLSRQKAMPRAEMTERQQQERKMVLLKQLQKIQSKDASLH
jgi:hypothetical protein